MFCYRSESIWDTSKLILFLKSSRNVDIITTITYLHCSTIALVMTNNIPSIGKAILWWSEKKPKVDLIAISVV